MWKNNGSNAGKVPIFLLVFRTDTRNLNKLGICDEYKQS